MERSRITHFKEQLLKEKEQLEGDLNESATKDDGHWETKRQPFDEAGRFDEEERADEVEEYENETSIDRQLETRLEDITGALHKIDADTYGICERCGKAIDETRLTANPAAHTHVHCNTASRT
ncbi:TraR/DksA C4-type zinc finger protein [Candidatus Azambacteria bacterium]|nr:TraR/DksA C4-type zinc finger protein [Candidatus Azambacteria bacterium]